MSPLPGVIPYDACVAVDSKRGVCELLYTRLLYFTLLVRVKADHRRREGCKLSSTARLQCTGAELRCLWPDRTKRVDEDARVVVTGCRRGQRSRRLAAMSLLR